MPGFNFSVPPFGVAKKKSLLAGQSIAFFSNPCRGCSRRQADRPGGGSERSSTFPPLSRPPVPGPVPLLPHHCNPFPGITALISCGTFFLWFLIRVRDACVCRRMTVPFSL